MLPTIADRRVGKAGKFHVSSMSLATARISYEDLSGYIGDGGIRDRRRRSFPGQERPS